MPISTSGLKKCSMHIQSMSHTPELTLQTVFIDYYYYFIIISLKTMKIQILKCDKPVKSARYSIPFHNTEILEVHFFVAKGRAVVFFKYNLGEQSCLRKKVRAHGLALLSITALV
jgi:hypothetical protein